MRRRAITMVVLALTAACYRSHTREAPGYIPDGGTDVDIACSGSGLVHRIRNECMDDAGETDADDELEIYCCDARARLCLSHEACPWRMGCTSDGRTCSTAGLSAELMARAHCDRFMGYGDYYCAPDGTAHLVPGD